MFIITAQEEETTIPFIQYKLIGPCNFYGHLSLNDFYTLAIAVKETKFLILLYITLQCETLQLQNWLLCKIYTAFYFLNVTAEYYEFYVER